MKHFIQIFVLYLKYSDEYSFNQNFVNAFCILNEYKLTIQGPSEASTVKTRLKIRFWCSMDDITDSGGNQIGMQLTNIFFLVKLEICAAVNDLAGFLTLFQWINFFQVFEETKLESTVVFSKILILKTGY